MNSTYAKRILNAVFMGGFVLATALFLMGCSEDDTESTPDSGSEQTTQSPQQQGQMPGQPKSLSPSEISEAQLQTAARIAMSVQMGVRADQMKMQKEMMEKYGNPQQMDSTQKAQARKEMRSRQLKMRKKQMRIMQEEAKKEGMEPQTFRQIMRSAQQDSTLRKRLQEAMRAQMKQQQPQMNQSPSQ